MNRRTLCKYKTFLGVSVGLIEIIQVIRKKSSPIKLEVSVTSNHVIGYDDKVKLQLEIPDNGLKPFIVFSVSPDTLTDVIGCLFKLINKL